MIWEIDDRPPAVEGLDDQGRPDPQYARSLGLISAPLGRRAGAAAIDLGVYLLLQLPYQLGALPLLLKLMGGTISLYGFVNHPQFVLAVVMAGATTLLTAAYCLAQLLLHGRRGVTLGKALLGIRSVNVRTLERPGFWRVVLRALVVWAPALTVVGTALFLVSPTFDAQRRGRGWHDLAGQTWLVDVRHGLNPYDAKRMRIARKSVSVAPVQEASRLPSLATPVDPGAAPAYRPGARVSSGVLGVARPVSSAGEPSVGLAGRADLRATPAPAPAPALAPAPAPERAPVPTPDPASPAPVAAAVPAPASGSPAATPQRQPAPIPPARSLSHVPIFTLQLDTGDLIPVATDLVLGRDPQHPGAQPIRIPDETRSLSKTHLLVRPDEGGVVVIDQQSTNGTSVVQDGTERQATPGAPTVVRPGEVIRFGDRTAVVMRG